MDSATVLVDKNTVGMRLGMTVSEFGNLSFSKSGRRLFFGVSPIQPPRDTTLVDFEHARVDIWHYNDDYLQTVQNFASRLQAARQENFSACFDLEEHVFVQLGDKSLPQVLQTGEGDGDQFIGITDTGRRVASQWQGYTLKDIYAIEASTGNRKLVKANLAGTVYPSTTGKFILWYDRKARNYFVYDGKETRNISSAIKYPLWNEESDIPEEPGNYGIMGWHQGDSVVYIYDRYDAWAVSLVQNKKPFVVTGLGRPGKFATRYIKVDDDEKFIRAGQPMYFRFQNEVTKEAGLWKAAEGDLAGYSVTMLSNGPYMFSTITKARDNAGIIYTKENFNDNPDIYFQETPGTEIKLSAINPQQANYLWGNARLFKWKALNGKAATGIVYTPEDFDSTKKYPMIIYFYEKLSQGLFDYKEPAPIRSALNVPFFVSRGYIVFMPDIEYKTGYPGQSAYDYIVSGANALVKKGWVDSKRMALQGHSWGGYQAAQLATMTPIFKAVWAGAPVANMTSAYGGIRWESGASRQFQYERTQSRIGGTLWEKLPLYLKNSPLFHLDKVTAPMVIMHNDADGAVPWYQGIEMFTALRRLGKKVWMFNYNGQGHGLSQRQDMLDYQIRMQQFFDWILKDAPPAKWITEGVPAVKKGKEWGIE
jgi:dipeptidyl aminopeptidase/acylaminoacyl peptidase